MAIKDINEIYQDYIESNKFKASLYTPANAFAGYLDLIAPKLSLRKDGFDTIDFRLAAKNFTLDSFDADSDYKTSDNPFLDTTLDGYYLLFEFGDIEGGNQQSRRFIIKDRNSELSDEQAVFSYVGISAEYELKKLPIINWPGIEVKEYKDFSNEIETAAAVAGLASPTLLNATSGTYVPISLRKIPKDGKMIVTRKLITYDESDEFLFETVDQTLFRTTTPSNKLSTMPQGEYYYDETNNKVIAWVPAKTILPISTDLEDDPEYITNNEVYQYFIYYETNSSINESTEIIDGEFEKAYFYNTDGLTINQILDDLFQNLTTEDSNLRYFHR